VKNRHVIIHRTMIMIVRRCEWW